MIIMCTCMGICGFLAHTAIKAVLDVAVGIGYVANFLAWAILSIITGIYTVINIIVSFILTALSAIIWAIALIVSSIPILNVIVYIFGQWAWSILGAIFFVIHTLFGAYLAAAGIILSNINTIFIILPSLFNSVALGCRSVIAPTSIPATLIGFANTLNVSLLTFFEDFNILVTYFLECFSIFAPTSAPMGQGFGIAAIAQGMILATQLMNMILFVIWNIVGVFIPYALSVILYLISIPLDLILSAVVWIGGGFCLGVCGTI